MPVRCTIHSASQPSEARSSLVTMLSGTKLPVPTICTPARLRTGAPPTAALDSLIEGLAGAVGRVMSVGEALAQQKPARYARRLPEARPTAASEPCHSEVRRGVRAAICWADADPSQT